MPTAQNGRRQQKLIPDDPDRRRAERAEQETGGRLPPQDLNAEIGVLTSLLMDPDKIDDVFGRLDPDDFYSDANRQIFIALQNVHAAGRKIDLDLMTDRLRRSNQLDAIGGVAYLMELFDAYTGHSENIRFYADIVRDMALRRRVILTCSRAAHEAYDQTLDAKKLATETETKLADVAAARDMEALNQFGDVSAACINQFVANKSKPKEQRKGVRSSLHELDRIMGPYEAEQLSLIAARTSQGKSALATSEIAHWLEFTDHIGLLVTLEMSALEAAQRILCAGTRIDIGRFRDGMCGDEEIERMRAWRTENDVARKLYIDDGAERTIPEIIAMARRTRRIAGRLSYLVVDYLQLVQGTGDKYAKRHEEVSKITRGLKIASRELEIPIIALCQLNREADQGKPRLSHLRESGSLEQDASVVCFISRETEGTEAEKSQAELIVAKNRHGKCGSCNVHFWGQYQLFSNPHEDF